MCSSAVAVEPAGECPLLAISGHRAPTSRTSALPPKADIQSAKSGQGVIIQTDPTCRPTYPLGVVRPHLGLPQWLPLVPGGPGASDCSSPSTRSFAGSEHISSWAGGGAAFFCLPQKRLRLLQRRKRSRKRPPKPRSSQPRYNERLETALMGTSRWVILTLRSKRPWGQKKIPDLFFPTRGKKNPHGQGLSILWDGQPLASDCRSHRRRSLLFEHNAVQISPWLANHHEGQPPTVA